jgi:hypothetical protein
VSSPNERRAVLNSWLVASILFATAATAIWPLIQMIKYHMPVGDVFHEEVTVWLGPEHLGARPFLEIPFRLTVTAWIVGGLFAFAAPFAVLFWKQNKFSSATKEIAILCLASIALAVLFNFRSVRYIVPIIPSLCVVLAIVLHRFLEQRSTVRIVAAVLLALILIAGLIQAEIQIHLRQRNGSVQIVNGKLKVRVDERNVADQKRVAENLGALQQPDTGIVLVKAIKEGSDLLYDSFYLFHGNLRLPVTKLTVDELRGAPPPPPVLGVCVARDFPIVQEAYRNAQTQFTRAQFILWRADAE